MKRIISIISVFALLFTACEGDPGPPGPQGPQGTYIVGQSFERTVNFTAPNYQETVEVPLDIQLFETDMVLVYHLKGQFDGYDIWKPLPETVSINSTEEFRYNFEHNYDLITIFIESHPNFDFSLLLDDERINQTFRIVVLPVDFVNSNDIDVSNYSDVMQYVQ